MIPRRSKQLLVLPVVAALALAACGSDSDDGDAAETTVAEAAAETTAAAEEAAETTAAAEEAADTTAAAGGEGGALAGICPETVVLQTDWMPEAEHGFIYELIGEGYEIDKAKAYVTGPLIDGTGADTGVDVQIRSGGGAQNFQPVTQIMYTNDDILMGFVYTDEAIQFSAEFPTVAVFSGFEKNPQMIMWDPATYPDVKGIADLKDAGVLIRYFGGAAYMDFLKSTGVLDEAQLDGSYSGDPSLFIADEGKSAQQGFGSAEPYLYENEIEGWGKPVAYEYINDIGWENYAQSLATTPANLETYGDCFSALVPIIQQATVNYLTDPSRTNATILDAAATFGGDFGWDYSEGTADYGVATIKADGLQANGPDGVIGKFDTTRVTDLIAKAIPVYTDQGSPPKDGLVAEDIVTNEFLDETIGL